MFSWRINIYFRNSRTLIVLTRPLWSYSPGLLLRTSICCTSKAQIIILTILPAWKWCSTLFWKWWIRHQSCNRAAVDLWVKNPVEIYVPVMHCLFLSFDRLQCLNCFWKFRNKTEYNVIYLNCSLFIVFRWSRSDMGKNGTDWFSRFFLGQTIFVH